MKGELPIGKSLILAPLFAALLGGPLARATEYEVDGTITQTWLTPQGESRLVRQAGFTIYVRDCNWMIETMETAEINNTKVRRQIGTIDGVELFEIIRSLDVPPEHWDHATISSNAVPVGPNEASVVGHLWLMFASGCHLRSMTSGERLTPVYDYAASPYMAGVVLREARWDLIEGPASLPSKVTYYDDSPNNRGAVRAVYTVLTRTNAGAISFPATFVFEQRDRSGKSVRRRAEAAVTAVRPECSRTSLIPLVEGRMTVSDMRLKRDPTTGGDFHYSTNRWLPIAEARGFYDREKERNAARYQRVVTNVVREIPLVDPWEFSSADILSAASFSRKLNEHADPVSDYLWKAVSDSTRRTLTDYAEGNITARQSGALDTMLQNALAPELKRILQSNTFYTEQRFPSANLAPDTQRLLAEKPKNDALHRLNRMLLEDFYPGIIQRSVRTVSDSATGTSAVVDYANTLITFYDRAGEKLSSVDLGAHVETRHRASEALMSMSLPTPRATGISSLHFTDTNITVTVGRAWYQIDVKTGRVEFRGSD